MSYFSYNYLKNLKRPEVYLCYPTKEVIGTLKTFDLQTDLMANSADKAECNVYKVLNGEDIKFYDDITLGKYLHIYGVGWFRIDDLSIVNESKNDEYKEISASSLESELDQTYLTSFGSLGTDDDEQGGLDRYCLYNILDQEHSILHIFLQKNPGWSIRYVDPEISTEYRSFQEDSVASYTFLTGTISETYECFFVFDSYERSVSAFKLKNLGKDTCITLNYRNVIKSVTMKSDESDVKTVLTVTGGNDNRTNTPLGIIDVNIGGTNQIYNFSWYTQMMSDELKAGLQKYSDLCKTNSAEYQNKMTSLKTLYEELNELKNKVPDEGEDNTDWTKFGLRELQEKSQIYWDKIKTLLDSEDTKRQEYNTTRQAIEAEITVRNNQIDVKNTEINNTITAIQNLTVSLPNVLGSDLYKELGPYIREDTMTDDSYIVTNTMTDAEILEMQKSLLEHGQSELQKVCSPQFTLDIDLINFTVDYDYKRFTDALEMYNIIHINFEDRDDIISARLLKLHINWDDPSDFTVTFSNRNSLEESWALMEEIQSQTEDMSSKLEYTTGAWRNAAIVSVDVNKYMNNVLNAAKQQIASNDNNEVLISKVGIQCRKWLEERQKYDPAQIWITNNVIAITQDDWNTVGLAIGYVKMDDDYFFGVVADTICGRLLMSQKLIVSNESGSYTIDKDGFTASQTKDGSKYSVKINPDTPDNIFSIAIDDKKLLYVDTTNKALTFEGKIIAKSGTIASFDIADKTLTSGNIGLNSDTISGQIAFWAGSTDRNNAAFRVSNTGTLTCSNAIITGGSLKVGDNFSVNSQGILTAAGATVSGKITATSGKIGGWTIDGNDLVGTKGSSYIRGGEINIGSGFFRAYEDQVILGDFEVISTNRGIFQSRDEYSGMSSKTGNGNFVIWGGYNGSDESDPSSYAMACNSGGQLYCKELLITTGEDFWQGWTLTATMRDIYSKLERLDDRIDNLDSE